MTAAELARVMPDVARHFWGEPNPRHSSTKELRWGTNGARSVDVGKGTWFDHEAKEGGGVIDFLKREGVREIPQWLKQHGFSEHQTTTARSELKIVATYDYTDESGALLFQVVPPRAEVLSPAAPGTPGRPAGQGEGWLGVERQRRAAGAVPPARADRGAGARNSRLFVVEGEKDVLTLARHGIPATCNAGGAHKWDPAFAEHLAGADVIVIPDNDKDGHEHAQEVARSLAGKAARIRVAGAARPRRQGRRVRLVRRRRHRRGRSTRWSTRRPTGPTTARKRPTRLRNTTAASCAAPNSPT